MGLLSREEGFGIISPVVCCREFTFDEMMDIEEKKENLRELYEQYEKDVAEFKKAAACEAGCADCCIGRNNGNNHVNMPFLLEIKIGLTYI